MSRQDARQVAGWTAAGSVVLALHAAVGAWALRPGSAPEPQPLAAAVMIELAPVPVAPPAVQDIISVALRDRPSELPAEARPEAAPLDASQPDRDQPPSLAPEPVAEATPEPRVSDRAPAAEAVAPPPPRRRQAPQAAPARASLAAPPAVTPAAEQTSSGTRPASDPASWMAQLIAQLERHKRYPISAKQRGQEGVAKLVIALDPDGRLRGARLAKSSGVAALDAEVLDLAERAAPLPPPPPGVTEITVPVTFSLH